MGQQWGQNLPPLLPMFSWLQLRTPYNKTHPTDYYPTFGYVSLTIFSLWTHGDDELQRFLDYLNTIHPTIQFTYTVSDESADFLDTKVFITQDRRLATTLYRKPTDTVQLLHYKSNHPLSTKLGIIYSQALRLRRLCTTTVDFENNLKQLLLTLIKRQYPIRLMQTAFDRARQYTQDNLLFDDNTNNATRRDILPFIK